MTRSWIVVAAADHLARGVAGGFMQANHGKRAPLARLAPGDVVIGYSPSAVFGIKDGFQTFTSFGHVGLGEPYQVDMGGGFTPFRRDVAWWAEAEPAPIRPMLPRLSFTAEHQNWGYLFRRGLFPIEAADADAIAVAMHVSV